MWSPEGWVQLWRMAEGWREWGHTDCGQSRGRGGSGGGEGVRVVACGEQVTAAGGEGTGMGVGQALTAGAEL